MRLSWLMPFRNAEAWIAEAVASMLADSGQNDELILVDDGSTDNSCAVLPEDPRIRLIRQGPLGIVAALETGRKAARAPYIARMDADDLSLPGRLKAQVGVLEAQPQLAAIGGRGEIHADGEAVGEGMRRYVDWVNGLDDLGQELLVESPLFHPAVCFRAAAVEAVGGYREGAIPEDYDLWLRLVSAGWKLANLPQNVVRIRDRPDRLTRSDPRYDKAAFRRVRQSFLAAGPLSKPSRVIVWGGKKGARPWLQWLAQQGHALVAVIDSFPGPAPTGGHRTRGGSPLLLPEDLPGLKADLLLVAVGRRGARELIRAEIAELCPHWKEGRDWWALL
jgi:glycosyltransferase involved in cell wall biosynthesis